MRQIYTTKESFVLVLKSQGDSKRIRLTNWHVSFISLVFWNIYAWQIAGLPRTILMH